MSITDPESDGLRHPWLLDLLRCPACASGLVDGGGELRCAGCDVTYPVRGGVPWMLADDGARDARSEQVRSTFEHQWSAFGENPRIFGKTPEEMRELVTGDRIGRRIDADFYRGRRVLDVGCGHGRYLTQFAELGATVVGVDVGSHLPWVLDRVPAALRDRIACVRGDALKLPLGPGAFDLVFCDGVLHHTRDPRSGFAGLARAAAPGGSVYVWLYPREGRVWEGVHRAGRAVTTRLPRRLLEGICYGLAPLLWIVPTYSRTRPGRASWSECAQVIYDWLGPAYQSHHTPEEVESWYREEGLGDVERLPVPVGCIGVKPR